MLNKFFARIKDKLAGMAKGGVPKPPRISTFRISYRLEKFLTNFLAVN